MERAKTLVRLHQMLQGQLITEREFSVLKQEVLSELNTNANSNNVQHFAPPAIQQVVAPPWLEKENEFGRMPTKTVTESRDLLQFSMPGVSYSIRPSSPFGAVYSNDQLKNKIETQAPILQSSLGALVGGYKRDPIIECGVSPNLDIKRLRCSPYPPLEARRCSTAAYNSSPKNEAQQGPKPRLKEIAKMRKATNVTINAKGATLHKVLSVTDCNPAKNRVLINRQFAEKFFPRVNKRGSGKVKVEIFDKSNPAVSFAVDYRIQPDGTATIKHFLENLKELQAKYKYDPGDMMNITVDDSKIFIDVVKMKKV